MTIKEYAKQQGISPQAVYQRLKKNKVKIEQLTEKGTGEITGEGIVILNKLFDPENRQTKPAKDEIIDGLQEQLNALKAEKAALLESIEQNQRRLEELQKDKEYYMKALEKEQNNYEQIIKLLPAATNQTSSGKPERLTWRERITGRRNPGSSSKG